MAEPVAGFPEVAVAVGVESVHGVVPHDVGGVPGVGVFDEQGGGVVWLEFLAAVDFEGWFGEPGGDDLEAGDDS